MNFPKKQELAEICQLRAVKDTFTVKRFRVGKSNLFIVAGLLYEDDLFYEDLLRDAMTLKVSITNSSKEKPKF